MKFRCEIDMNTTDPLGGLKDDLEDIMLWVCGCEPGPEPGDLPQDVQKRSRIVNDGRIVVVEFVYDTPKPKRG